MITVIVHNLKQATTALAAAKETSLKIALLNPSGSHAYLGVPYILEMYRQAAAEVKDAYHTTILDVGDDASGFFLGLQGDVRTIIFSGSDIVREKLKSIALAHNTDVVNAVSGTTFDTTECQDILTEFKEFLHTLEKEEKQNEAYA